MPRKVWMCGQRGCAREADHKFPALGAETAFPATTCRCAAHAPAWGELWGAARDEAWQATRTAWMIAQRQVWKARGIPINARVTIQSCHVMFGPCRRLGTAALTWTHGAHVKLDDGGIAAPDTAELAAQPDLFTEPATEESR